MLEQFVEEGEIKKKDEAYYRRRVMAILHNELNHNYYRRIRISSAFDTYNGDTFNNDYEDLLTFYDTEDNVVPYIWTSVNKSKKKARVLAEELSLKGFAPRVEAINAEAKEKKSLFYKKVLAEKTLKPFTDKLEKISGLSVATSINLDDFETIEDLENYTKYTYQDNAEIVLETILRYNFEYYNWLYKRMLNYRDVVICGSCAGQSTVINGYPQLGYLHPLNIITDSSGIDDLHEDDNFVAVIDYPPLAQLLEEENISKKEFAELRKKIKKGTIDENNSELYWDGLTIQDKQSDKDFRYFRPIEQWAGEKFPRGMRVRAYWRDTKSVFCKVTKDRYGKEITQTFYNEKDSKGKKITLPKSKKKKDGSYIKKKEIQSIYTATLVGGQHLVNYGECNNVVRDPAQTANANFDIQVLSIDRSTGKVAGLMNDIGMLQSMRDYLFTRLQQEIAKYTGSVIYVDIAKLPSFFGQSFEAIKTSISYLKSSGIQFYEDKSKIPDRKQPIGGVDISNNNSLRAFIELQVVIDNDMKEVSGVGDVREGKLHSANQLTGTTELTLNQSFATTNTYPRLFKEYEKRLLNIHLQQCKMMWVHNPERFSKVLGTIGINHLESSEDLLLNDYGIFFSETPITWDLLLNIIMTDLQSHGRAHEVLALLMDGHRDPKRAARKYVDMMNRIREENQAQRLQEIELSTSGQLEKTQFEAQSELDQIDRKGMYDLKEREMMNQKDLGKTTMKEANKKSISQDKLESDLREMLIENGVVL